MVLTANKGRPVLLYLLRCLANPNGSERSSLNVFSSSPTTTQHYGQKYIPQCLSTSSHNQLSTPPRPRITEVQIRFPCLCSPQDCFTRAFILKISSYPFWQFIPDWSLVVTNSSLSFLPRDLPSSSYGNLLRVYSRKQTFSRPAHSRKRFPKGRQL